MLLAINTFDRQYLNNSTASPPMHPSRQSHLYNNAALPPI